MRSSISSHLLRISVWFEKVVRHNTAGTQHSAICADGICTNGLVLSANPHKQNLAHAAVFLSDLVVS